MTFRRTFATTLPGARWRLFAVALAVGIAALGLALSVTSAQTPPITGFIGDDNLRGKTPCVGDIRSDEAHCDIKITVTNHTSSPRQITVDEVGTNGAFDASRLTPGSSTLADCPCVFTVPGNWTRHYRLRIKPTRSAITAGYFTSTIKLYAGSGTSGRQLHSHRINLKYIPDPTVITVDSTTDTTIDISWTADRLATSHVILFWQLGNRTDAKSAVARSKSHTFSGLLPRTTYWIQVQPTSVSVQFPRQQIKATTSPATTYVNPCKTPTGGDYDSDDDGLIEICSLKQLDAIRHDLNGDGVPDVALLPDPPARAMPANFSWDGRDQITLQWLSWSWHLGKNLVDRYTYYRGDYTDAERITHYTAAFPSAVANMGCPSTGCKGYELSANLDFDQNNNGLRDDDYNTGSGWRPIMGKTYDPSTRANGYNRFEDPKGSNIYSYAAFNRAKMFTATFEGNAHTIANLYISRSDTTYVGLFGVVAVTGTVRNVGLLSPYVRGDHMVGSLVGLVERAHVSGSYALDVNVEGNLKVGGLVGIFWRDRLSVQESYATGRVHGGQDTGGLVGILNPYDHDPSYFSMRYAFASVYVTCHLNCIGIGGLVGNTVRAQVGSTYATGRVERTDVGYGRFRGSLAGLTGSLQDTGLGQYRIASSYTTSRVTTKRENDDTGGVVSDCLNVPWKQQDWGTYWLTDLNGDVSVGCPHETSNIQARTSTELTAPTSATGIYSSWGPVTVSVDGQDKSIPVWDFGTSEQYPILAYCGPKPGIDLRWDSTRTEYCPLREATQWGRTLGKR